MTVLLVGDGSAPLPEANAETRAARRWRVACGVEAPFCLACRPDGVRLTAAPRGAAGRCRCNSVEATEQSGSRRRVGVAHLRPEVVAADVIGLARCWAGTWPRIASEEVATPARAPDQP